MSFYFQVRGIHKNMKLYIVRQQLGEIITKKSKYQSHLRNCEMYQTDFCTCGLDDLRREYNEELKHIKLYSEEKS